MGKGFVQRGADLVRLFDVDAVEPKGLTYDASATTMALGGLLPEPEARL